MKYQKDRVGDLIRRRRKELGFKTQGDLAAAIGADQPTVARWETGTYFPSNEYLIKLCEVLEVTKEYLLGDTGIRGDLYPTATKGSKALLQQTTEAQDHVIKELFSRIDALEAAQLASFSAPASAYESAISSAGIDDIVEALLKASPRTLNAVRVAIGIPEVKSNKQGRKDSV